MSRSRLEETEFEKTQHNVRTHPLARTFFDVENLLCPDLRDIDLYTLWWICSFLLLVKTGEHFWLWKWKEPKTTPVHVHICLCLSEFVCVCVWESGRECIHACQSLLFQFSVTDIDQSRLTSLGHGAISACGRGQEIMVYRKTSQPSLSACGSSQSSPQLQMGDEGCCPQAI